jgi:hypothetical protein
MLCVLAGGWLVPTLGQAAVEDLYQADVPVSPDSGPSYEEALEGRWRTLVKVSGRAEVASQLARGRAAGLVQRYGYRSRRGGELLLWSSL